MIKKYVIMLLAVLLVLTGCTRAGVINGPGSAEPVNQPQQSNTAGPEPVVEVQSNTDNSYFGQYQMSEDGFSKLVKDNAIDRDYKAESAEFQESPEFSTQSWVQLEAEYTKLWDKELNNIYNKLLGKLNAEEKEKLLKAEKGWVEFHLNESGFVVEAWEDMGLGSQGRVQLVMAEKDRIRERTLQLMEYYYMLGGEVKFLYQGDTH